MLNEALQPSTGQLYIADELTVSFILGSNLTVLFLSRKVSLGKLCVLWAGAVEGVVVVDWVDKMFLAIKINKTKRYTSRKIDRVRRENRRRNQYSATVNNDNSLYLTLCFSRGGRHFPVIGCDTATLYFFSGSISRNFGSVVL